MVVEHRNPRRWVRGGAPLPPYFYAFAFVGGSASKRRAQVFWLRGLPAFYPSEVFAALCDIQMEFSRPSREGSPSVIKSPLKPYFPVSKTYNTECSISTGLLSST